MDTVSGNKKVMDKWRAVCLKMLKEMKLRL